MATPQNWRKSSYSGGGDGNNCVEIATSPTRVHIRDSKTPATGTVTVPATAFVIFVTSLEDLASSEVNGPSHGRN